MREGLHSKLDDVEKGERLKCIFEILNKDKKRYERIKNNRSLSSAEQKEYEECCSKLTSFYEKCRAFIKPRKNGPGKFMVQAYVNWCVNQNALMANHSFPQGRPDGSLPNKDMLPIGIQSRDKTPEKTVAAHTFAQSTPHMQRSGGYDGAPAQMGPVYEQSAYRGPGYEHQKDGVRPDDAMYKVPRGSAGAHTSPYFPDKSDVRMEFDSRRMYSMPGDEHRRPAGHGFYTQQGFGQPMSYGEFKTFPLKGQHPRPFQVPAEHMAHYNIKAQGGIPFMDDGAHEAQIRGGKEQYPHKGHPFHVKAIPGERPMDGRHRLVQGPGRGLVSDQEAFVNQDPRYLPKVYGLLQKTTPRIGTPLGYFDKKASFPYKTKPDRSGDLESVLGSDKSPEYAGAELQTAGHSNKGSASSLYVNTQRAAGVAQSQTMKAAGPMPPRPYDILHNPQVSVPIPAKRKQKSADDVGGRYSFEFACDARPQKASRRDFTVLHTSPQISRQRMHPADFTQEELGQQEYLALRYRRMSAPGEPNNLRSAENVLLDSSINSKMIKLNEKFSTTISNIYKMTKNFRTVIRTDPKLHDLTRRTLDAFCEELGISVKIPSDVALSLLIHLDCILHKTLFISGMIAQSRADRKVGLDDFVHAFNKVTMAASNIERGDKAVFNETLANIRAMKEN